MSSSVERLRILPLASPSLRSDFMRSSVFISLLPLTSNVRIDGRSCTTTTSTALVAAHLDVAEETRVVERPQRLADPACAPIRSPMLTGNVLNTVPSLMRCSPSTRMPATVNSSAASPDGTCARARHALTNRTIVSSGFIAQYDRRGASRFELNCYGVLPNVTAHIDGTLRPARGNTPEGAMATQKHILIVDEDRDARAQLAAALERPGYRVTTAGSGGGMQRALERARIDLVVLDVSFSEEDGMRLCRACAPRAMFLSSSSRAAPTKWIASSRSRWEPTTISRSP